MSLIRPDSSVPMPALLKRFALVYLPIVIVLSIGLLSSFRFDEQRREERIEGRENSRIEIAKGLVTRDLSAIDADLRVIANLPFLRWYQDSGDPAQREELEKLFLVFAKETRRYDQVRYLDASGQEVIRINYNDGKPAIVSHEQLQNKAGRYYFDDTIKLNQGEIFVSPLDLNIEQDRLEIPYKPMIRFGTPVFDSAGRKKGVILLNYFGDKLLQHFREVMQGGDPRHGMLLNRDGYWLSGAKREDEWGFMLGKKELTFGHDFAEEWRFISVSERGTLLTDRGLFVYTTVYPLLSGQRSSSGSALANSPSRQEVTAHEYYWKIVSFVPHAVLSGTAFYNQTSGRILLVFVYLLLALASWIIASVTLSRRQVRAALRDKEYLLLESQRIARLGSWHYVLTTGKLSWSDEAYRIYGVSPDTFTPNVESLLNMIHPDDRPAMQAWIANCAADKKPDTLEFRIILPDGTVRFLNGYGELRHGAGNNPHHMIGIVHDITERKQLEGELKRQARTDVLTGLNNRRHFLELAEQELARAKRLGEQISVLMLDVDHFKLFNDTYGHHVGDMVLQKLSEVCVHTLREIDIPGRLGGEEFAILLPETKGEQALEVAERLRLAAAGAAVPLEQGGSVRFTVSIGVACFVATDARVDDVLRRADAALYAAKNAGRNRVCSEGTG